jgi:hypothetical protein
MKRASIRTSLHRRRGAAPATSAVLLRRVMRHLTGTSSIILLLLAGVAVLLGGAARARTEARGQQPASGLRAVAQWIDPKAGMSLSLALQPPRSSGLSVAKFDTRMFAFELPNGDELRAASETLIPLANALAVLTPEGTFDQTVSICRVGLLASASKQTSTQVDVALNLHVGQGGLLAYAEAAYGNSDFCIVVAQQKASYPYKLHAGCDSMAACGSLPSPIAAQAAYDQAVTNAVNGHDWSQVYTLTSTAVTAQYPTALEFTSAMEDQVKQVGRINQVASTARVSPLIQFDSGGQPYFITQDNITRIGPKGSRESLSITSYYLLQGGVWKLWFSCGAGTFCNP